VLFSCHLRLFFVPGDLKSSLPIRSTSLVHQHRHHHHLSQTLQAQPGRLKPITPCISSRPAYSTGRMHVCWWRRTFFIGCTSLKISLNLLESLMYCGLRGERKYGLILILILILKNHQALDRPSHASDAYEILLFEGRAGKAPTSRVCMQESEAYSCHLIL